MPGDGIGPEITASVVEIFAAAQVPLQWEKVALGLEALSASGTLIPAALTKSLEKTKVGLKGPTTTPVGGGHRSINVSLRQEYDLYANVRPIRTIPGVTCLYKDIDMIIVRENTEDLYKGIEHEASPGVMHGIKIISEAASRRIGMHAFTLARKLGRKKVTIVHKANIMKLTDGLFLDTIRKVGQDFPEIRTDDIIVDNCCMQMVTKPQQFDVIVTQNLYGDILSDLGSGLIGGLGVAGGANLGERCAVFEAVHGSAPDIAGQDKANPTALLLSSLMMLEHMDLRPLADRINKALLKTIADPATRTRDLGGKLGTAGFTEAVIANL